MAGWVHHHGEWLGEGAERVPHVLQVVVLGGDELLQPLDELPLLLHVLALLLGKHLAHPLDLAQDVGRALERAIAPRRPLGVEQRGSRAQPLH